MDATVLVAGLGFASTLLRIWLTASFQRRSALVVRVHDAKIIAYSDCAAALYEFERVTYNRNRARMEGASETEREKARQEVYRSHAQARAAIVRVAMLSSTRSLSESLEAVREEIGGLIEQETRPT